MYQLNSLKIWDQKELSSLLQCNFINSSCCSEKMLCLFHEALLSRGCNNVFIQETKLS